MKAWCRAVIDTYCGGCGRLVHQGDPMVAITFPKVRRRLWRCVSCADMGEPVPDLPPVIVHAPIEGRPFVHIRTGLDALPFDFKAKAANEREPGEDG
jgi:hypothetical protein